ncbi:MAG: ABC transporter ATP-binding protein [Thermodesulfobacteriota bacterium]
MQPHDFGYFEEGHLGRGQEFRLWRRLLAFARPYRLWIMVAVLLSLAVTGATLAVPYLVRLAVDHYIVNTALPISERLHGLLAMAGLFAVAAIAGFGANFCQVKVLERTGQSIMQQVRQRLFRHLLRLDLGFFQNQPTGKLVTRVTNDIQNLHEMFTSVIVTVFNDALTLIGILVMLFWLNWRMTLLMLLLLPLLFLHTLWFSRLARDAFRAIRTGLARINAFLQESLSGVTVLQLFGREQDTRARFAEVNEAYLADTLRQIRIFGVFMPAVDFLNALGIAAVLWFGGGEIMAGRMTIGTLVAFLSYLRLFFQPLRELSQKSSVIQSALASGERIFELLDRESAMPAAVQPKTLFAVQGAIRFEEVTFGYEPGKPVLREITFAVAPGETIALVGATGSGKSTVINLLERFYDPQAGTVRIDSVDLRELAPEAVRGQIGLIMQEVFVVPGTLRENILLGREVDETRLARVVADAQLAGLVAQLPGGLDARIGEGGAGLSAGQRQLLAFARVLARDPRILVLDEATANIDSETEIMIDRAMAATLAGRTSIVIAHRLSTVRRANRIVVLDHGRIVEQGTHRELLARQGFYAHLHALQFSNGGNGGQQRGEG